ncbi:MAG: hypothetical protein JST42_21215, partial [Bacteroidetes bacterium]|nr:hypothetical protein [Bacteroidota bacterium]
QDRYTDICFLYTMTGDMDSTLQKGRLPAAARAMEDIASWYGIPSIDLCLEVAALAKKGDLVYKGKREDFPGKMVFSPDNVHPYPETGHRLYTEAIARSFAGMDAGQAAVSSGHAAPPPAQTAASSGQAPPLGQTAASSGQAPPLGQTAPSSRQAAAPSRHASASSRQPSLAASMATYAHPIPAACDPEGKDWEDARMISADQLTTTGGWTVLSPAKDGAGSLTPNPFPVLLRSVAPGAAIRVKFEGTKIGLFDVIGPGTGQYEVIVDAQPPRIYRRFDGFGSSWRAHYFILSGLTRGIHTIEFRVSAQTLDKKTILKGKDIDENPDKYKENACFAGYLLLDGPLVPENK